LLQGSSETAVVHLHAPFEVLFERCLVQAQDPSATERPLARERATALQRYLRRQPFYAGLAHHTATVADDPPKLVAEAIRYALLPGPP
jgi:shikimate kinase